IQIGIVVVAGRVFFGLGWPPDGAQLALFAVVGVVCFAALGVALSHAIPNSESAPAVVNAVFVPVILISGVFFDVKHVPIFLRDIAQALPLDHLITGISGGLVAHHGGLSGHVTALWVIGIWTVLGIVLAVRGFSWEAHRD